MHTIKAGDSVRLMVSPPWTSRLPATSQEVIEFCVGRTYRVAEVTADGLLVLDVSVDVDARFGGFMNDIRVEPEYVELQGSS